MSRYMDVSNLDIPSDENDYDELVAFADKIAEMIVDAPSIDICFCGECKHCSKDRIKWSVKDEDGNWIDTKCNLCRRTKLEVRLDDFCSCGEREGER